jgi:hypothetical protein
MKDFEAESILLRRSFKQLARTEQHCPDPVTRLKEPKAKSKESYHTNKRHCHASSPTQAILDQHSPYSLMSNTASGNGHVCWSKKDWRYTDDMSRE